MAIMLGKTYHALKAAGAPEEDAIAAAEELAAMKTALPRSTTGCRLSRPDWQIWKMGSSQFRAEVNARFSDVGSRFSDVGSRFTMLTWAVGINAAATIAILGVLLKGH